MNLDSHEKLPAEVLEYLINHIFLPPNVPQEDDYRFEYENILLKVVTDALIQFKTCVTNDWFSVMDSVIDMVKNLQKIVEVKGIIHEERLRDALRDLCVKGGTLLLHIREQNCGVMMTKVEDFIQIEAFELSPLNRSVIATLGRLRRSFPGPALSMSVEAFQNPGFQAVMAETLAKMSNQRTPNTRPKVKKAKKFHDEDRDTTHPKIVTELFFNFLRPLCEPVDPLRVWKNTRDEVMWHDSFMPWHRSPLWLLLRVGIQLVFSRHQMQNHGTDDIYKLFMVYLLTHILEVSHKTHRSCDTTYAMQAKISRRLLKLDSIGCGKVLTSIGDVMRRTTDLLTPEWTAIIQQAEPNCLLSDLAHLKFSDDAIHSLQELEEFILEITHREHDGTHHTPFHPLSGLVKFEETVLPDLGQFRDPEYMIFNLQGFETWIGSNLNAWIGRYGSKMDTCGKLGNLICAYHTVAAPIYAGNPEATSMMLLTILDLWIACDKSAICIDETIREYDVGVPENIFQCLMLRSQCQMRRLECAENYLRSRRTNSTFPASVTFQGFGQRDCYSVKYFNRSSEHQSLLKQIESEATQRREEKRGELYAKKERYNDLMLQYRQGECDIERVVDDCYNTCELQHSSQCRKCSYFTQANAIEIQIYEWPLPKKPWEAQSTVFELRLPPWYGFWRDIAMFLLLDVLGMNFSTEEQPRSQYPLSSYSGLQYYFEPYSGTRGLGLLSQDKPHGNTHRARKLIVHITEDEVCLDNALHYRYHDSKTGSFVNSIEISPEQVPDSCMYALPQRASSLQQYLRRPAAIPNGPPPNSTIANQFECPDYMSLDEYKALAHMPLGYQIQWQNILVQLSLPVIDFRRVETTLFTLQTIYQTGPPGNNALRQGHSIMEDNHFSLKLLDKIEEAMQNLRENWECAQALHTLISLTSRVLTLTSSETVQTICLSHMSEMRHIAYTWVNILKQKVDGSIVDHHRQELLGKAVLVALICIGSFDVDQHHLRLILTSPDNSSILIQSSITIEEAQNCISKTLDPLALIFHMNWKRLLHRAYPIMVEQIVEAGAFSLDDAIQKSWPAYQPGTKWRIHSEQEDHWLLATTASQSNGNALVVHYNILTGELLVNGHRLASLPPNYERHPSYRALFGRSSLEIMPSAVPGMQFSSKKKYAGYIVHFSLDSDMLDLHLRIVNEHQTLELVPSRLLRDKFPSAFIGNFVHWYDIEKRRLEFRPLDNPWSSTGQTWFLTRAETGQNWCLTREDVSLLSIESLTATRISQILAPLEAHNHIHMTLHVSDSTLEIDLPRLQLSFNLDLGDQLIRSRQFRGFCIDADQSLGSLVGFKNKLLLRHQSLGSRLVVLLEGEVSLRTSGNHIAVSVDQVSNTKAHTYNVDSQIGRLVDNGTLQSKLLLCYLHGLTSFCLPDPLTMKTGTEQALSILESAAVQSFDPFTAENIRILEKIAHLTPGRTYYPQNKREMQTVMWTAELGFLAQHGSFLRRVKSLLDEKARRKFLWPDAYAALPEWSYVDPDLLARDLIRSSTFRVSGFGAEDHTEANDAEYNSRDCDQGSPSGFQAFLSSKLVYSERDNRHVAVPSHLHSHLWEFLSQRSPVFGPDDPFPLSELAYDTRCLMESYQSMSTYWTNLHRIFSGRDPSVNKFRVMMWLSTLAFANSADTVVIQTLISFFTMPRMAEVPVPIAASFQLSEGYECKKNELQNLVKSSCVPIHHSPEAGVARLRNESWDRFQSRKQRLFKSKQKNAVDQFTSALMKMWPCMPTIPTGDSSVALEDYVNVEEAMKNVREKFETWLYNKRFYDYLGQITFLLQNCRRSSLETPWSSWIKTPFIPRGKQAYVSIDDVFGFQAPPPLIYSGTDVTELISPESSPNNSTLRLRKIIETLECRQSMSSYEETYVRDLKNSLERLQDRVSNTSQPLLLRRHLACRKGHFEELYELISSAVKPTSNNINSACTPRQKCLQIVADARHWPRLAPSFFLEQLKHSRWRLIPDSWKSRVIDYGLALAQLQRAERIVGCLENRKDVIKEIQNTGHRNWSPFDYPDSLLLEIESGIMIRDVQEEIARDMRNPPTDVNAVMQLNMGEGKSSVIVPIVASALADGSRLVRVIVAKPQAKQMFQILVSKLGGMVGRRIYHLPFSRALKLNRAQAEEITLMCQECMENGGVLLVQPEQILSLKIMGLECLISGKESVGQSLLNTQAFFDAYSRDIVDESDENFSVKFELVYTVGDQQSVQLSPERWILIHQVLDLVRTYAPDMKNKFPLLEIGNFWEGNFPRTRVIGLDAQRELFSRIAKDICETGLKGFPIARQPENVRAAVHTYITTWELTSQQVQQVENKGSEGFWGDSTRDVLFLLRGLLAGGILAFAFGDKRWRVNYGLTAARQPPTKLAVPYRAKDNPTARSEFSHPDVVIILTCLSYYYAGLESDDLFLAFHHLLNADQAEVEYQSWVTDAHDLPQSFHQLVSINLEDRYQCIEDVFPPFRFAKSVIDYFLSHIVFPKEMKEFPNKLSASGWDIGQKKRHPTTGFSGTNDSRKVLPLSVEQLDLPEQTHTNALVLEYLLQPDNSVIAIPPRDEECQSDAQILLSLVKQMSPPAQVILDVGAQVLELSNAEVAREWLRLTSNENTPQAVVFCDDDDNLCVMDRKGHAELLQTSPFAKQLDVCYVFLDEAHTRGTDLKLPENYRAAVTLGANLTKDRLVQACMRMRRLGHGQTVVFCVPDEIQHKIRTRVAKSDNTQIEVSDVLIWAISETWDDIKRSIPLWATQGQRFQRQDNLWNDARTDDRIAMSAGQARQFLEEEAQSLEKRYKPRLEGDEIIESIPEDQDHATSLIMERCREFDNILFHSAKMNEEQERELSPEIQRERQVQRPAKVEPAEHSIHPDLRKFISAGVVVKGSMAFLPAFTALAKTSAAVYLDVSQFPGDLLVTTDYSNTVRPHDESSFVPDLYQRPVQWILTGHGRGNDASDCKMTVEHMVIISPYEAQELYQPIKNSKYVTLHVYAPRSNLGLRALDKLDLYSVPEHGPDALHMPQSLIIQLNLFAGQLYLGSYKEYVEVCNFLGLACEQSGSDSVTVAADGFILRKKGGRKGQSTSTFSHSPIKFLKVLMSQIRRADEGIGKTHLGKIFDGMILRPSDFTELA